MLPSSKASGKVSEISITAADWQEIEAAYGSSLPSNVRESIIEATNRFLYFEAFERNAEPLQPAIDMVKRIRAASNELRDALGKCGGLVGVYAQSTIKDLLYEGCVGFQPYEQFFSKLNMHSSESTFHAISEGLLSLSTACTDALSTMGHAKCKDDRTFREGERWQTWIRHLETIARDNDLPAGVSKGRDKSNKTSPFVRLVEAVQERLPRAAQRHGHSIDGLTTAIDRARQQVKSKKSSSAAPRVRNSAPHLKK
jgi:hypothetical protein